MMRKSLVTVTALAVVVASHGLAWAQSSSLYVTDTPAHPLPAKPTPETYNRSELARASYLTAKLPEPRLYSVNDLVTLIVRENTQSDSTSNLATSKENKIDAIVTAFPNLNLSKLFNGQVAGGTLSHGPELKLDAKNEFDGNGTYGRKDSITTRVTAKIIDVKPNGTIVLEARKFIQSDDESLELTVTGTCRKDDIAPDNTVQSTQLYDLRLRKEHTGELRNASQKGLITKVFELLFNF